MTTSSSSLGSATPPSYVGTARDHLCGAVPGAGARHPGTPVAVGPKSLCEEALGHAFFMQATNGTAQSTFAHLVRQPAKEFGRAEADRYPNAAGVGRELMHTVTSRRETTSDPLDALNRQTAQLAPIAPLPAPVLPATAPAAEARACISLEDLVPALVRKVAWSGDGSRGVVRMELGSGALAGGTLQICVEAGRVRVHLNLPAGVDMDAWRGRIARRLAGRGLDIEEIVVE